MNAVENLQKSISRCWCRALMYPGLIFLFGIAPAFAIVGQSQPAEGYKTSIVMILTRTDTSSSFCSSLVLSPLTILTAGHCVDQLAPNKIKILAYPSDDQPKLFDVSSIKLHPLYQRNAEKRRVRSVDLAVLQLAEPLPASYHALKLDSSGRGDIGQSLRLMGYGIRDQKNRNSAGQLRIGLVEIRPPVSKLLLWTKGGGDSSVGGCYGDSGGAILKAEEEVVMAVTAFVDGYDHTDCGKLTQGVYVAPFLDWINEQIR